jgi:preprotein translocase subunit SecF
MPAISYARITILGALVTVLLAAFFLATRGLNLTVDLTGGTIIEVHYPEAVASNSVQNALVMAGVTDTKVSGLSAYPLNLFVVFGPKDNIPPAQLTRQVLAVLRADQPAVDVVSIDVITSQVAMEILMLGLITLIITLVVTDLGVTIYLTLRFGWRFALPTMLINTCTTVFVLALFLIAFAIFQWEFSFMALLAMTCLGILAFAFGAIRGSIAGRSHQELR